MEQLELNLNMEEWKPIPNHSKYLASTYGRIKIIKTGKIRKETSQHDGYIKLNLINDDGKRCSKRVHRLVMLTFCGEPPVDKTHVNHIDGDKTNNHLDNLEWTNPKQNNIHSIKMGLTDNSHFRKPVIQLDNDSNPLQTFKSALHAATFIKTNFPEYTSSKISMRGNISLACQGINKTAYGFKWEFKNQNDKFKTSERAIKQIDVTTNELICVYKSIADASREIGVSRTSIKFVCDNKRKTSGGFKWEYVS